MKIRSLFSKMNHILINRKMLTIFLVLILFSQIPFSRLAAQKSSYVQTSPQNMFFRNDQFTPSTTQSDGYFTGTWKSQQQSESGRINGTIKFARSDTTGNVNGIIFHNQSLTPHHFSATVYNRFLFGRMQSEATTESTIIFGSIQASFPSFSFSVYVPSFGMIHGTGEYDGSFLPAPTGSFNVGVRSYHVVDATRDEWFTENDESDHRELMMKVWYPTTYSGFDKRTEYMDEITFSWLRNQGPVPLFTIPNDAYTYVHPYVYENVQPARNVSFPVLLFSPGYDGVDVIYTSFIDELVSHGYVVVSMNHPYVSGVTVFPDGRAKYIADRPGNFSESREFLMHSQRTVIDDALFVLDTIEDMNTSDSLLSGIFDLSNVGMFGHSFGGAATMSCCYEDERVQAGFTLDGVVYDDFLTGQIETPFLLMCAEQRFYHSSYDHVWNQFSSDAYQVGIIGSAHYDFTDVGILLSHFLPFIPRSVLGFGSVDSQYLIRVTRLFEKAFFDVYLKGAEKEELVDLFDDFDDVLIRIK